MKKIIYTIGVFTILTIAFYSCNKQKSETLFTTVMKTDKGDIRGINLNSTPETVKKIEQNKPDSVADGYLEYRINIPDKNANVIIAYSFDQDGLYSADINVKITGDTAASFNKIDTLQSKITKLLIKKYGAPVKLSDEAFLWNYTSESGSSASAQLINNSKIEGTGSLELLIQTEVE